MAWKAAVSDIFIDSDTITELVNISILEGANYLWLDVVNSDLCALTSFEVSVRGHNLAPFHIIANATSDFTSAVQPPILGCNADLTKLAASGAALLWMDVRGLSNVKCRAISASDTRLDYYWQVR